jgi:hypothetical protein
MAFRISAVMAVAVSAISLGACVTTSMQGYADLQPPGHPILRIAAIAPPALVSALSSEASRRGVMLEDANIILPPTRQYNEAEVRQAMVAHGIDGVLVVNVTGDSGVKQQYAGSVANTTYSGTSSGSAMVVGNSIYGTGMSSGSATTVETPIYRYKRVVAFQARLSDPQTSRKFWVGSGQVQSGGALFVGDSASASNAASTIFNDLQTKGLIGTGGA